MKTRLDTNPYYKPVVDAMSYCEQRTNDEDKGVTTILRSIGGAIVNVDLLKDFLNNCNGQLDNSLDRMKQTHTALNGFRDILIPRMDELTTKLRTSRMAIEFELNEAKRFVKDFHETFHSEELGAIYANILLLAKVCGELKQLQQTGIIDVVTELVKRMEKLKETEEIPE